ncbi:uncharacterized protein METZ01_LOCUS246965 [marine metagenome]|uniref:Uncharacterized protein n=1 Tax=marine metagenome TaxID=408172 RepID=A0A382I5Y0_9ZZZZ
MATIFVAVLYISGRGRTSPLLIPAASNLSKYCDEISA